MSADLGKTLATPSSRTRSEVASRSVLAHDSLKVGRREASTVKTMTQQTLITSVMWPSNMASHLISKVEVVWIQMILRVDLAP